MARAHARPTKRGLWAGGIVAAAMLAASVAGAQAPPTPNAPEQPPATQPDTRACAQPQLPAAPSQKREPGADGQSTTGDAPHLSDHLAKSDGVICPPPGIDPEIRAPAPDVGRMPVIPPPGSPGGDPTVRPK